VPRGGKREGAGRKPKAARSDSGSVPAKVAPQPKAEQKASKAGRPTDYRPEYCEQVVEFMRAGFSLTAFAGHVDVARSTINVWMEAHPEFSEAVSRAKAARLLHWEEAAIRVAAKGGGPGTATIIVFGLKNMAPEEYSDMTKHELTGKDGKELPASSVTIFQLPDNGRS
jgi:hypothetical protein